MKLKWDVLHQNKKINEEYLHVRSEDQRFYFLRKSKKFPTITAKINPRITGLKSS